MRIILLGPPGAGKGTQAQFITKKYNIPQISTGEMLRTIIKSNSELSKRIKGFMNTGKLIADAVVISLVRKRIDQSDCQNGFLLDGFPRTLTQAYTIKKMGINIDYVIEIHVPDELIVDRVIGRRVHIASGRIYHTKFNPPKIKDRDDVTNETLTIRQDDQEEIIRKRLDEYHQITKSIIEFYQKEAYTNNIQYIKIDGTKQLTNINAEIRKILG